MSNEITLKAWKNLETPSDHMYLTKDIERGQLPEILELAMGASTNPAVRDMLFLSTLSVYRYLASLQEEGLLSGAWGNYSKTN